MRSIPDALAGGAMTSARCWLLRRRDGQAFGFTDHDADLVLNGVTCFARSGLSASDMTTATGFEVTGGEMSGALSSLGMTEGDITSGLYDGAEIDLYLVDWTNLAASILIDRAMIGEIRRNGAEFICEMRGLSSLYQEEKGRLYQRACSADLGDAKCGVNLDDPRFQFNGRVTATNGNSYLECAADPALYNFNGGSLRFTAGANSGRSFEIKSHVAVKTGSGLWLWTDPPDDIAADDMLTLYVGCDKSFATCGARFGNHKNFRGFPHIPGTDFVLAITKDGAPQMDGGSLFQ